MRVEILGSAGFAPSVTRETACVFVRDGEHGLLLDVGTGARRLLTGPDRLAGVERLNVLLTHFHLDHVCGLTYLPTLGVDVAILGPGAWLYGRPTADILAPLLQPPISPDDVTDAVVVKELEAGEQAIGSFRARASAQPNHWAPSVGLRIDDAVALITDTPYEPTSAELAAGVSHLLHEAWSASAAPSYPEHDATAADAARVALEAGASSLTLIHLDPRLRDLSILLDDARAIFAPVELGEDEMTLEAD